MNSNYESVFKNPEGFTQQEISQFRMSVTAYGKALIGRRLAIPISDNLDMNYKKKIAGDMPGLTLSTPLKKYMIETVDLWSIDVVRLANGKVVMIFNNDEKLQFDICKDIDTIVKASPKDVQDAILEFEATGKKRFFWNVRMVTECINSLNESNLSDINNFIDELALQGNALENVNKINQDDTDSYYKSIGE